MITIKTRNGARDARAQAVTINKGKPVYISCVYFVRDSDGIRTGESRFLFERSAS